MTDNPLDPFKQLTSGLVDGKGRPLGTTEVERNYIEGVVGGIAFLLLEGGKVGVCQLAPDDCWVTDMAVRDAETGEPGELLQTLMLRVKPGWHQFAEPWDGIPGTALAWLTGLRSELEAARLAQMGDADAILRRQREAEAQYDEARAELDPSDDEDPDGPDAPPGTVIGL